MAPVETVESTNMNAVAPSIRRKRRLAHRSGKQQRSVSILNTVVHSATVGGGWQRRPGVCDEEAFGGSVRRDGACARCARISGHRAPHQLACGYEDVRYRVRSCPTLLG